MFLEFKEWILLENATYQFCSFLFSFMNNRLPFSWAAGHCFLKNNYLFYKNTTCIL